MMKHKILICEDEKNIVSFLTEELNHAGYETDVAYDGETAVSYFQERSYALVLLDLMLPKKSGLEILSWIRTKSPEIPIIVLTARKDTFDKVLLLKTGADDYVTKPFETLELLARIERCLQRGKKEKTLRVHELSVDYESFSAKLADQPLSLTKTEFEILYCLVQNADKVLSREHILSRLYGDFLGDSNVVDVNIKNIRRKLAEFSTRPFIETVRGKGYVIRK